MAGICITIVFRFLFFYTKERAWREKNGEPLDGCHASGRTDGHRGRAQASRVQGMPGMPGHTLFVRQATNLIYLLVTIHVFWYKKKKKITCYHRSRHPSRKREVTTARTRPTRQGCPLRDLSICTSFSLAFRIISLSVDQIGAEFFETRRLLTPTPNARRLVHDPYHTMASGPTALRSITHL